MNPTHQSNLYNDGIVAAMGIVLLIGTATGNAYVMLGAAIAALLVIVVVVRQGSQRNVLFAAFAVAAIGALVAIAVAKL